MFGREEELKALDEAWDDGLYAFSQENGQQVWRYALSNPMKFSCPVVQMDVGVGNSALVVVSAGSGSAHAVRATNGQRLWESSPAGGHTPTVGFAVRGRELLRLRGPAVTTFANDGHAGATFPALDTQAVRRYPAVVGDIRYYGAAGHLRSINTRTSATWNIALGVAPIARSGLSQQPSPKPDAPFGPYGIAIDKDMLLLTNGNYLYAFEASR